MTTFSQQVVLLGIQFWSTDVSGGSRKNRPFDPFYLLATGSGPWPLGLHHERSAPRSMVCTTNSLHPRWSAPRMVCTTKNGLHHERSAPRTLCTTKVRLLARGSPSSLPRSSVLRGGGRGDQGFHRQPGYARRCFLPEDELKLYTTTARGAGEETDGR